MKKWFSFLLLFLFYNSYGQCDAVVTLRSQIEVNNFSNNYPGCTTIRGLLVSGDDITNLNGLSQLTAVTELVSIRSSTSSPTDGIMDYPLTDISGLNNLTSVGGKVIISDLKNLSTSSIFRNLTSAGGIQILGLTPPVVSGFYNLLTIGEITITSSTLIEFSGFTFLSNCNQIYISNNPLLHSIGGFVNLTLISDLCKINGNPNLIALPSMPNLIEITGYFEINDNDFLIDLKGVENLTKVGRFLILNNNNLTNLDGVDNLSSIGDGIQIESNPLLTNLKDLSNVITVNADNDGTNSIGIINNALLNSLTGLENISTSSIGSVIIHDNSNLSACSISNFCQKIVSDGGTQNFIGFGNNAVGCNSGQEISNACKVLSVMENDPENTLEIYPNPVKNKLYLKNALNDSAVSILDLMGRTHLYSSVTNQSVDVSKLANGIYLLIVNTDKGVVKTKFIKQ